MPELSFRRWRAQRQPGVDLAHLSFTVCLDDAEPVDNSVFCSGDFVIVLATEQDFAFKINDLHAVPVVLVILGGMGGQCVFYGSIERLGKCTKKHSD